MLFRWDEDWVGGKTLPVRKEVLQQDPLNRYLYRYGILMYYITNNLIKKFKKGSKVVVEGKKKKH